MLICSRASSLHSVVLPWLDLPQGIVRPRLGGTALVCSTVSYLSYPLLHTYPPFFQSCHRLSASSSRWNPRRRLSSASAGLGFEPLNSQGERVDSHLTASASANPLSTRDHSAQVQECEAAAAVDARPWEGRPSFVDRGIDSIHERGSFPAQRTKRHQPSLQGFDVPEHDGRMTRARRAVVDGLHTNDDIAQRVVQR
jgi:hypothetical protein